MLQRGELEAIRQMRERIQKIEQRLEALDAVDSYGLGRLAEACKTADAALASMLVVAEVYLGLDALPQS